MRCDSDLFCEAVQFPTRLTPTFFFFPRKITRNERVREKSKALACATCQLSLNDVCVIVAAKINRSDSVESLPLDFSSCAFEQTHTTHRTRSHPHNWVSHHSFFTLISHSIFIRYHMLCGQSGLVVVAAVAIRALTLVDDV